MKHTQGEWVALEAGRELPGTEGGHEIHAYVGEQLVLIAEVSAGIFSTHCPEGTPQIPDYEITEAEALAAFPDLLAALKALVETCEYLLLPDLPGSSLNISKLALKKAGVA